MLPKFATRSQSFLVIALPLLLCACNATPTSVAMNAPSAAVGTQPGQPAPGFNLPAGTACSDDINNYESIADNDLTTGNVEQQVYDAIQKELTVAAANCSAGKGAEARALVAQSKKRHGYS